MSNIRDDVSTILSMRIQGDSWEPYVDSLDRQGKFTRKTMLSMLIAACQTIEQLEVRQELLAADIERLTAQVVQGHAYPPKSDPKKPLQSD